VTCFSPGFSGIPVNGAITITYQAVVHPQTCPATLPNQAMVTWTSLPGPNGTLINPTGSSTVGPSGANNGERDGVTPLPSLNDYKVTVTNTLLCDSIFYEYAVKFVCGVPVPTREVPIPPVARGAYFTAINVHNFRAHEVKLIKKFAVALPGEKVGSISPFFSKQLKYDEAMEIDCPDIKGHLRLPPWGTTFVKGFAVIRSRYELDIVAVYTASATFGSPVVTLAIERVPKRP
jgi:hypothetical protein